MHQQLSVHLWLLFLNIILSTSYNAELLNLPFIFYKLQIIQNLLPFKMNHLVGFL